MNLKRALAIYIIVHTVQKLPKLLIFFKVLYYSIYYNFLLEETSGCYDLSDKKERHCLIINRVTFKGSSADNDMSLIEKTMNSLHFDVTNGEKKLEINKSKL